MRNIKELFEETVAAWPGKPAIRFRHEGRWKDITRGEFIGLVKGVSVFLGQEGIRKGDKIGIVMKNRPEWPAVFLGAVSEGAVCVPIDPGAVPREIENIVKDSGCVIVFTDDSTLSAVKDAGEKCPSVKKVISVDSEAAGKIFSRADGLSAKDAGPGISPEDIACILYTSGTTGGPKGIMLSHGNLTSNCDSIFRMGIITAKDSVISVLPLHHTYPLTVTMLLPLLYGGEIIYPASIRPEDLAEAMRAGATVFVAVPQILSSLHGKINGYLGGLSFPLSALARLAVRGLGKVREKTGVNLPGYLFFSMRAKFGRRLRFFVSGGAKLDENVTKGLFSLGFTVLEGYGLTEASPVLTFNPPARPKAGSVGVPIPHVEIGLADKDEKGVGEVIARGPNGMKGY